jgi:uncharacterized Zn-finger protein
MRSRLPMNPATQTTGINSGKSSQKASRASTAARTERSRRGSKHAGFRCTVPGCDKQYSRGSKLREHISSKHGPLETRKPYVCSLDSCSKRFSNRPDCERHEKTHDKLKDFECGDCKRGFSRKDSLEVHQKSYCTAAQSLVDRNSASHVSCDQPNEGTSNDKVERSINHTSQYEMSARNILNA